MRLLHLVPRLSSGGAERQLRYLVEALAAAGHDVHVGYVHRGDEEQSSWPATLHQLRVNSNANPLLLQRLWRLIHTIQPDILQTWLLQMDVAGGLIALATRRTWVLRESSMTLAFQKSWKFRLRGFIALFSDAIVSNSSNGASYWARRVPKDKLRVIHNAIPHERIRNAPAVDLQTFGCPPQFPAVLYAGRLVSDKYSEKNLVRLLHAMRSVNQHVSCSTVIAGSGPQLSALRVLVKELGIESSVFFVGHLPAETLWGAMKAASAFALVSPYEGMPNAVMEAAACGCPAVLSDIPPHRELLESSMALYVRHDDVTSIAQGVLQCLTDRVASRERALKAHARAESWSIADMATAYQRLYAELTGMQ